MTTTVHIGRTLTGRLETTVPVTGLRWDAVLNAAGSIEVTIPEDVVRDLGLRERTYAMRNMLVVEEDDGLPQAGPITSRSYDYEKGELTLGAQGIWHWFDRRIIRPPAAQQSVPIQDDVFTLTGKSLGGLARGLVQRATSGGPSTTVPIVLPPDEAGVHTESWPQWQLARYGEQLRQITQRATDAPDIGFPARRRTDDRRFIEWVMRVGTELAPDLSQGGPDWVFDASAPETAVRGISTDEDGTAQALQVFVTGNGQEQDILFANSFIPQLIDLGWPLTEADASYSTVEQQSTLNGHAEALVRRLARPVEVTKVDVTKAAAAQVSPGDYCRLITRGDGWLGDSDRVMRIQSIAGNLSDKVTLSMFPMQAVL